MDGYYRDAIIVAPFVSTDENEAAVYGAQRRQTAHVEEHVESIRGADGVERISSHKVATPRRVGALDRVWIVASEWLPGDDPDDVNAGRVPLKVSRARRRAGGLERHELLIGR